MSFGFGVGDFLAVAALAWKLSTVLRSAGDASESYRELIQELESTAQSLYHTGKQLETAGLPASAANCLSHGISRCHTNLRSLEIIIKKYAQSMQTPKGNEGGWYSLWPWGVQTGLKKISWEIFEKERVDEFRRNIRSGVVEIILIIGACGLNTVGRMESKMQETCAAAKRVEAAIPQCLGAWHWDHKVVYLDDALGRSIPIAFELCSQWEVFNETLKLAFRGRPGSSWIEAKLFKITTQDNQQVLPAKWESFVKPSTTLLMSMVVQQHRRTKDNLPIPCPVCSQPQPKSLAAGKLGSQRKSEQLQCTKCFTLYSVSAVDDPAEVIQHVDNNADDPHTPHDHDQMQLNRSSAQERDIKSFKRLHVVRATTLCPSLRSLKLKRDRLLQHFRRRDSAAHPDGKPFAPDEKGPSFHLEL